MTEILYISTLCSVNVLDNLFKTANQKPEQAVQKFHRLLAEGFAMHRERCNIETLSAIPVVPGNQSKKIWSLPSETVNNVKYSYIPIVNLPILKNIGVFIYTFIKVFFWALFKSGQEKTVFCDILNVTIATSATWACKLTNTKNVAIVTDIHGQMVTNKSESTNNFGYFIYNQMVSSMLHKFNGYVLLTQQMNQVVNPKKKTFIIMEGLVDIHMKGSSNELEKKSKEKIVIYAGGLYEKYGVKNLIDAFGKVEAPNAQLHLYGNGEMVKNMDTYIKRDSRVQYLGMVPNKDVVKDQLKATLLANPRPTHEVFTQFSFPSKNMEYMVSGTPMVTTELPGMPLEYKEYVYLFTDETTDGMSKTLNNILMEPSETLHEFGAKAKRFVLQEKNNKIQSRRILDFLKDLK